MHDPDASIPGEKSTPVFVGHVKIDAYLFFMNSAWVPFPEPGFPNKIKLIIVLIKFKDKYTQNQ